ncbi:hypothetical protein N0V91_008723 [Didymella pomorum]|uniref:Uncharacterized protein n=1 Tax=Didymella pomorum TaxID=749634 RepID=A0A9W8Z8E5_9PLEO|nr:hypothetical protein N0V91_008723 [Didymella pomorum]
MAGSDPTKGPRIFTQALLEKQNSHLKTTPLPRQPSPPPRATLVLLHQVSPRPSNLLHAHLHIHTYFSKMKRNIVIFLIILILFILIALIAYLIYYLQTRMAVGGTASSGSDMTSVA